MRTSTFLTIAFISGAALSAQAAGDPVLGQGKSYACTSCHGADGLKQAPGQPILGGRPADQLVKAMQDIRAGRRLHPYMQVLMLFMTDKDMADIAAYYASVDPTKAAPSQNPYLK